MGSPRVTRFEHAELYVRDLELAEEFYRGVMGLQEIHRDRNVLFLGCGLDTNYDLALREGRTGVAHFAIRVDGDEDLDRYARRLREHGVTVETTDGREPGQQRGLRFLLPSGHLMELVLVADNRYHLPYAPILSSNVGGFHPQDVDHINLLVDDVHTLAAFLCEILDFRLSDVIEIQKGVWSAAWTRFGDYHHDIGMFAKQDESHTLHHIAWTMANLEHIKVAADLIAGSGIRLELGPSRHPVGANLFVYFIEPGGNRFELSAEGAVLTKTTPPRFWHGLEDTLDAWGDLHLRLPQTFQSGS